QRVTKTTGSGFFIMMITRMPAIFACIRKWTGKDTVHGYCRHRTGKENMESPHMRKKIIGKLNWMQERKNSLHYMKTILSLPQKIIGILMYRKPASVFAMHTVRKEHLHSDIIFR